MESPVFTIQGLPPVPPPALDPYLDAASRCFARYGIRRTSVQDVAQELGVNRTTVYRQVGTIEQLSMLLTVRDGSRVINSLPERISWPIGPRSVIELIAAVVAEARAHPVLAKILADERDVIGAFFASDSLRFTEQATTAIVPLVALAMSAGNIARRDPVILTQWLVRITLSLVLTDPPGDVAEFLAELLLPALTPVGGQPPSVTSG
ncbi:TetR/AcrR family transcriptional regulator [Pseudonocardia sp. GCM10023141]|uniref:TetR/AcrR family transcriptional regulator n=1 Tax=Pseudonocardia sp. GCM10023141 TaxID=3252653 RepID=UPI003617CB6A